MRYAQEVRHRRTDERPGLLNAVTEAKAEFAAAVLAGEPFGPAFLEVARANADLYAHELQYADALGLLGQSPFHWPEPRPLKVEAALAEVLEPEASRLAQEAADAMKARKREWIDAQAAGEDVSP